MENARSVPTDDKSRCLALQRVKARMIKETFLRQGSIDREDYVQNQVIKYSTLLSEQMLHKIKTEELKEFEKDVQDFCRESQKIIQFRRSRPKDVKELNVSQFLSDFKNSAKMRLLQNNKKRTKTSQSFELSIKPGRLISPEPKSQTKVESPLGNQKIKEAIEQNRKKMAPGSRFVVNGKGVNSQIIQLLEKLDEIESIEKLRKRRELMNQEEDDYLHGKTNLLKKEKERLSTAFENQERSKFKPMGRIKKDHKWVHDKNELRNRELDYLKKLHNRGSRAMALRPLKKSSIIVSSNYVGQASIHLEEGLPKSIRNHIPNNKAKKSESSTILNDEQKQEGNNQNITPPLLRSHNLFISSNFS